MIRVENIYFEYPGKRALDNVSFHIQKGSITALVGPNGAGKTTLMRSIAALDDPFSGKIYVNDIDVQENPREVHRNIGYLSDFFGLYDDLKVEQALHYFANMHNISQQDVSQKVQLAAERLGLDNYLKNKASELSRGWRQRLGIAQAIIHEPKLLLLDEPASGLDPEARHSLSELFLTLQSQGMTLLVSSHILAELEDYCTDMLLLRDGKVIEYKASNESQKKNKEQHIIIQLMNSADGYLDKVKALKNISNASANQSSIHCSYIGDEQGKNDLLKSLIANDIPVVEFSTQEKTLQDIYMDIARDGEKKNV